MTAATQPTEIACPHCGALNVRWDTTCWLCKQPFAAATGTAEAPILAEPVDIKPQFGLSALMLVITVICISVGLIAIAPGLIVPLVVIVVPALVRTAAATSASAGPVPASNKIAAFLASLGLVFLIWIAGLIALGAACTLIVAGGAAFNFSNDIVTVLVMLSIGAILAVLGFMGWLLYVTWPSRTKR